MRIILLIIVSLIIASCRTSLPFNYPVRSNHHRVTGSEFYRTAASYNWQQRDSFASAEILSGNTPSVLKKFKRIDVSITDSSTGNSIHAYYYVMPDYLSVGTNDDWARVPLTPMAAQRIADIFHCFLPTRKIVDDIYRSASVRLEPMPMFAYRDSTVTMWQHHLIIEGQRKGRKGLIAGIKKDVVISGKLIRDTKKDRVAIYGWHKPDGKPIQPLYTGHVNWYVDYSHGIRLVYEYIWVEGKKMYYIDVLQHPLYYKLICDEVYCDVYRY